MKHSLLNGIVGILLLSSISVGVKNDHPLLLNRHREAMALADSVYHSGSYSEAAELFSGQMAYLPPVSIPPVRFKYAMSLMHNSRYAQSLRQLDTLAQSHAEYLPEYVSYFKIKNLWGIDSSRAAGAAAAFIKAHPRLSLADSLLLPLADYYFQQGAYAKARPYYDLFVDWRVNKGRTAYAKIQSAFCKYHRRHITRARAEFKQIIRRHKKSDDTFKLVQWLKKNEPLFFKQQIFNISDVYFAARQYGPLRLLLENYIHEESDPLKKEKARYNLITIYFKRGRYSSAFYGFKNMLKTLQNKNLEPRIRIYLARIHLRKGRKRQAIEAYLDYADRYPRRRLAPEAVWKSAWIAEELRDLKKAHELYQNMRKRWPHNKLSREAFFREGFTLYRLGRIDEAREVFLQIAARRWPDKERNRASFWAAICYERRGDRVTAGKIREELAENIWDDYYTIKSFLMIPKKDSVYQALAALQRQAAPVKYQAAGYRALIGKFEDAFEVREVLNEDYAYAALEDTRLKIHTLDEWIALAEIYKKFNAYGKAYRTYDYINRKFFAGIPFTQKPFILKQRFPYYYDRIVEEQSRKRGLETELVLALMKQESVFDFKAHSWANAYGLMQLIPATAREMASFNRQTLNHPEKLFDPEFNIMLGTTYLRYLSKRFNGEKEKMLAAYNAGPHRVIRWQKLPGSGEVDVFIENIEYEQTRDYVRKVMKNYWAYLLLRHDFDLSSENSMLGVRD